MSSSSSPHVQEDEYYYGGYLTGVTATPHTTRETTYNDWAHANQVDRENEVRLAQYRMANNVRQGMGEFASKYVTPVVLSLAGGPATFFPELLGWGGSEAVDYAVNQASDDKYETWGQMMSDVTGTENRLGQMAWEFTNPGTFVGMPSNGVAGNNPAVKIPQCSKNAANAASRMKTSPELKQFFDELLEQWHRPKGQYGPRELRLFRNVLANPNIYLTTAQQDFLKSINFDTKTFVRNFDQYVGRLKRGELTGSLAKKSLYHEALTPQEIFDEFGLMGRVEEPVNFNLDNINEFFTNDVLPRMKANWEKQGLKFTPENAALAEAVVANPTVGVNLKHGYTPPGSGGYQRPGHIRFPFDSKVPESTIVHELHHETRDALAYFFKKYGYKMSQKMTRSQKSANKQSLARQMDNPAYTTNELNSTRGLRFSNEDRKDLMPTHEQGATVVETRYDLYQQLKQKLGRAPSKEEMDLYIDATEITPALINHSYGSLFNEGWANFGNRVGNHYAKLWRDQIAQDIRPEGMSDLEWELISRMRPSGKEKLKAEIQGTDPYFLSKSLAGLQGTLYGHNLVKNKVEAAAKDATKTVAGVGLLVGLSGEE